MTGDQIKAFELLMLTVNAVALPLALWAAVRWVHRVELRLARIEWAVGTTQPGEPK